MNEINILELKDIKKDVNELSLLFEISEAIHKNYDIKKVISPVLEILSERYGMQRGMLTIFNRENGQIFIEESYGLSTKERLRGRYNSGEGIIGKVVETGNPIIIPKVSEEPLFLNKTKSRKINNLKELSFICVPIILMKEVIGTLSIDRLYDPKNNLKEDLRLLSIIAHIVAQAVKSNQEQYENFQSLQMENIRLQKELGKKQKILSNIVGNSDKIQMVYSLIQEVAPTNTTVLIRGESGVGKELIAKAIYENSIRKHKQFVCVNCSAIPENLIEAELFGYEKGAFTGAYCLRKGKFESANGGTIFLDEIGDFSPALQVKLLRVLQEREVSRIGSNTTIPIDIRVISATNKNLEELIKTNLLREDFYYRINIFPIYVPSLRERKSDILLLANYFIEKYNNLLKKKVKRISTPAIELLMRYHWPGNIRELENCIERAIILSKDNVIHSYHLPPTLQIAQNNRTELNPGLTFKTELFEKELIFDALKATKGNMAKAAKILKITERQMGIRVIKYGIHPKHFF
ncbi:MAG: hypothetical protein ACD_79C00885G0001 [uncultured bacterium]|nr:MAG: hypothetical protein ACD_79C00885G0001 [uncultured bacterium]